MNRPVLSLFSLEGKVALVTGASSGLGVAWPRPARTSYWRHGGPTA